MARPTPWAESSLQRSREWSFQWTGPFCWSASFSTRSLPAPMRKRAWPRSWKSASPPTRANEPLVEQRIQTSFDGEVAYLTLANPPVNVIDFPMIAEIKAFLDEIAIEDRL